MIQAATDTVTRTQVQVLIGIAGVLGAALIGVLGFFIKSFIESVTSFKEEMVKSMHELGIEFRDYKLHVAEAYVGKREFRRLEDRIHAIENIDSGKVHQYRREEDSGATPAVKRH